MVEKTDLLAGMDKKMTDVEQVEPMVRGCGVGKKRQRLSSTRGDGMFSSDRLEKEDLGECSIGDLEVPNHGYSSSLLYGDSGSDCGEDVECLFPEETMDNEAESSEQGLEVHSCRTRTASKRATASCEEEARSDDEDEYLFCDDCDKKYHGDCPVHGPLSELDLTAGYDQASITYTQLQVPAQLTVRPSGIPGTGLGIFAVSCINKGIRVGPYEGRKVPQEDVGELHNMAYAWQVRRKGVNTYLIDGQNTSHSNWMRFVNCARHEDEQNILAFQYRGNIYYRTVKTIYPESELLVWYVDKFAKELDVELDTEASPNFCCRGCGGSFSEERSFNIHLKHSSRCGMAHPQIFTCLKCHKHFSQFEFLQQHISEHGNLVQDKQCPYCGKSFSRHANLQVHIRRHTGDKPYNCAHCGKCFNVNSRLQQHIRIHTGDKPFKCDHCEKCFNHRGNLKVHLRTHTGGDKSYMCDLCGKCFRVNSRLQRHTRTHSGDKPYMCDLCGKCFGENSGLQRHFRIHTGEKPHKCDYCGKCFCVNSSLQVHIRTHTGVKPYGCDHCGKSFCDNSSLKLHIRTHTGDKPYKCDYCGKCFGASSRLQVHIRTHTGNTP